MAEKEDILAELQQMHQSTSATLCQLQNENKQQAIDINELQKHLKKAEQERAVLISSHNIEKVDLHEEKKYGVLSWYRKMCWTPVWSMITMFIMKLLWISSKDFYYICLHYILT